MDKEIRIKILVGSLPDVLRAAFYGLGISYCRYQQDKLEIRLTQPSSHARLEALAELGIM